MNKARRAQISKLISQIEDLQVQLDEIKDEEQEYLDNMPESFQSSEKYYKGYRIYRISIGRIKYCH